MHESNIQDQFSGRISTYNNAANWMLNFELIQAHVRALGPVQSEKDKCLELCCGTGIVGKELTKQGWKVTGIDLTREMADEASKYFETVNGSIENMPFDDNLFDVAVIRQAYMLVDGPKALKDIHRVLKDGGIFVLGQSVAFSSADADEYERVQKARHINMLRYYTHKDLVRELEDNGFKVQHTEFLRVRESVNKWLENALALSENVKSEIFSIINNASEGYKKVRNVKYEKDELCEDWNWAVIIAKSV